MAGCGGAGYLQGGGADIQRAGGDIGDGRGVARVRAEFQCADQYGGRGGAGVAGGIDGGGHGVFSDSSQYLSNSSANHKENPSNLFQTRTSCSCTRVFLTKPIIFLQDLTPGNMEVGKLT